MRYGIFSDVHANVEAFESVVRALEKEKIDEYICVGDSVGYGAEPARAIGMTRGFTDKVVCGNHDCAGIGLFGVSSFNPYAKEAVLWTAKQLKPQEKAYLKALKAVYTDRNITAVHGSLDEPEEFRYILDIDEAVTTFDLMKT